MDSIIEERAELIANYFAKLPQTSSNLKSLFLSGVSRSGKSHLAESISKATGMKILYLDTIRDFYYDIADYECRLTVKKYFYRMLLTQTNLPPWPQPRDT